MKLETKKEKIEGKTVYRWEVKNGNELLGAGLCRTKSHAESDGEIFMERRFQQALRDRGF